MLRPEAVVAELRARSELWETTPGIIGMRGDLAKLNALVSAAIRDQIATGATQSASGLSAIEQWKMPSTISFATLERAQYFESFPHWLTAASHLSDDARTLERVAVSEHPGHEAATSLEQATSALPPAVCYHTYAALADSTVESAIVMTAEETCWRHEGSRLAALERGWAFTMREIVFVGDADGAERFRQQHIEEVRAFAESVGLNATVELATDPFFAPTARGKALLQRVKALKHELVIDKPGGGTLAISSFNNHERFFGDAFGIRIADGEPATSACVAFGVERWVLAILMTHGLNPANWPQLDSAKTGALR